MERGLSYSTFAQTGPALTQPLCFSIGVSEFTRWLAKAKPHDEIVYAHGARLDRKRDVVASVRDARRRGEVALFAPRQSHGGFLFIARRVATEGERRGGGNIAVPASLPASTGEAGRVLAFLSARAGMPCPTNRQIAVELRINDGRRVRYLIGQLEADGFITVERRGVRITRVVTITATGARTSADRTPVGCGFTGGVR